MLVHLFEGREGETPAIISAYRTEIPLVGPDERQFKVILVDADDSFDVIIHNPDGSREAVWSLIKDLQAPGLAPCPNCEGGTLDEYDYQRHVYICGNCGEEVETP
jgi:hypothetical protein